jgi:enoyl-CoA hydratase/carnithine racemase
VPKIRQEGDVFVLDIGSDENRFHPDWLAEVEKGLDQVEATEGPKALVTSATGKFWSNGLDLDWLTANADRVRPYMASVHRLFARVLAFPAPTVAAIQGHCFAAGAMVALAHDFRIMRADRGFFCFPEVDLQLPFTPGMSALIQAKLSQPTTHEAMTTGRRYGGDAALAARIVDAVASEVDVLPAAIEMARALAAKPGAALGIIKSRMYEEVLRLLGDEEANGWG